MTLIKSITTLQEDLISFPRIQNRWLITTCEVQFQGIQNCFRVLQSCVNMGHTHTLYFLEKCLWKNTYKQQVIKYSQNIVSSSKSLDSTPWTKKHL